VSGGADGVPRRPTAHDLRREPPVTG